MTDLTVAGVSVGWLAGAAESIGEPSGRTLFNPAFFDGGAQLGALGGFSRLSFARF